MLICDMVTLEPSIVVLLFAIDENSYMPSIGAMGSSNLYSNNVLSFFKGADLDIPSTNEEFHQMIEGRDVPKPKSQIAEEEAKKKMEKSAAIKMRSQQKKMDKFW